MNWEKLDLHIENIVPGLVLLTIILIGWPPSLGPLQAQKVVIGAAFIALAYMLGAVANLLARLLLDFVCRRTVRKYFMGLFLGPRLGLGQHPSRKAIDDRYSQVIDAGLSCGNKRVEGEVAKRRQTGRLVRSALVPTLFAVWVLGEDLDKTVGYRLSLWLYCYTALLLLYAYSEVTIFQEGSRGLRLLEGATLGQAPSRSASPPKASGGAAS